MRCSLPLLALLIACQPTGERPRSSSTPSTGTTGSGVTTGSPTGSSTGSATGSSATYDCSSMPDMPQTAVILEAPRGYNDLVFDADGAMVGHDGSSNAFLRATDPDTASPLTAQNDTVYKMGMLSGGDIVAATSDGGVIRVTPAGSVSTVLGSLRGYGLAVHANDMIYVATNYTFSTEGIVRVDPDTGDWEIVETLGETPRAIAFSRDFDVLYIGTTDGGRVLRLPLGANGDPTGPAEHLVTVPNEWHDTVEVDACGNIYVGSVFSTSIYRINADLSVDEIITWTGGFSGPYGHGFEWGDAAGGWDDLAIYITHPYIGSRVSETHLGVPGPAWPGTVVNGHTL